MQLLHVNPLCALGASPCTSNTSSVPPKFTILPLFNIQVKVGESGLGRSKFHLLRRQLSCTPKAYDYYFIFSRFFSLLHLKQLPHSISNK